MLGEMSRQASVRTTGDFRSSRPVLESVTPPLQKRDHSRRFVPIVMPSQICNRIVIAVPASGLLVA